MLSFFFHIFQPNVLIAILHILIILLHKDVVKDPEPHTKAAEKKKQRNGAVAAAAAAAAADDDDQNSSKTAGKQQSWHGWRRDY